jgi:hypothetical protein
MAANKFAPRVAGQSDAMPRDADLRRRPPLGDTAAIRDCGPMNQSDVITSTDISQDDARLFGVDRPPVGKAPKPHPGFPPCAARCGA